MSAARTATVVVGVLLGLSAGIGAFTFVYARGYAYMTNDPAACVNCHIMREQYDGWQASSHRRAAGCNDCHTPHDPVGKWSTKALNGFWHSFYFTTGTFQEPIRINARNRGITENACRGCHESIVQAIDAAAHKDRRLACTGCHASVGHLH
jgi:cytochrome c nitrite reductase small subunit